MGIPETTAKLSALLMVGAYPLLGGLMAVKVLSVRSDPGFLSLFFPMAQKITATDRAEALTELRKILSPGQTVYTVLRSVSSSGMSRTMDLLIIDTDSNGAPWIRCISWLVAKACGFAWCSRNDAIRRNGCGMDMGYDTVSHVGHTVWPDGTPESHGSRSGKPDHAGEYALKHSWL